MSWADAINGTYELLGGVMILANVRALLRDKIIRGVSVWPTVFFTSWGFWNLYFYPSLGQWLSFTGGLGIVSANALWLGLTAYYMYHARRAARRT